MTDGRHVAIANGERRNGTNPPTYTPQELRKFFKNAQLNDVVVISNHAIDRYRERFRPELSNLGCRRVLYAAMRERGQFTPYPPQWLYYGVAELIRENVGYIVIDDQIALPLRANIVRKPPEEGEPRPRPYVAVSCLSADFAAQPSAFLT